MAWGMIAGAAISTVGGALLSDDHGATGANDAAAAASREQAAIAREQWDRWKSVYQPLEDQYIAESQGLGSIANQNKNAGQAAADVTSSFAGLRERLAKNPGLNPSSQAYLQEENKINLAEAGASAASQNAARQTTRDKGRAAVTDALSLGKGMAANAESTLGSVANYNATLGNNMQNRADRNAAGFGKMVGGLTPAIQRLIDPKPAPGGSTTITTQPDLSEPIWT